MHLSTENCKDHNICQRQQKAGDKQDGTAALGLVSCRDQATLPEITETETALRRSSFAGLRCLRSACAQIAEVSLHNW